MQGQSIVWIEDTIINLVNVTHIEITPNTVRIYLNTVTNGGGVIEQVYIDLTGDKRAKFITVMQHLARLKV